MQSSQSKVQSEDPRDFNAKVNNLYVGENKQEFASRERFHGLPSLVRHALSSEDKKKAEQLPSNTTRKMIKICRCLSFLITETK